jgi:hypothetical protein
MATHQGWKRRVRYFVESKAQFSDIIPGRSMNLPMTTLNPPLGVLSLALWLVLAGALATPLQAQDYKINIGGANTEKAKQDKELAEKLPPEQAAAYLKSHNAWSTVGDTVQWLALVALPLGIIALVQTFRHRQQKLAHETMRLMIEKGLPVPVELINPPPPIKPPKSDLRRGLIWLALGMGLLILLMKVGEDSGAWAVGLIPAFIGVAYLVCWIIGLARERREAGRPRADLWPGILWTFLGVSGMAAMFALKHASGEWDEPITAWWGMGLIPVGIGLAFLVHGLVTWWLSRKQPTQG